MTSAAQYQKEKIDNVVCIAHTWITGRVAAYSGEPEADLRRLQSTVHAQEEMRIYGCD